MRFTPKLFRVRSYDPHQFTQPVTQIYARSYSGLPNSNTEAHLTEFESCFVLHDAPFESIQINHPHHRKHYRLRSNIQKCNKVELLITILSSNNIMIIVDIQSAQSKAPTTLDAPHKIKEYRGSFVQSK